MLTYPRRPPVGDNESLRLPVMPPVAPMLAKAVLRIPDGALSFEVPWREPKSKLCGQERM